MKFKMDDFTKYLYTYWFKDRDICDSHMLAVLFTITYFFIPIAATVVIIKILGCI